MDVVVILVDCIIERIDTPTALSNVVYNLMGTPQEHNLTPNFLQYPPSDYTIGETIIWTIPTDAPVIEDSADDYHITISSSNLDLHGIYNLVMENQVTFNLAS
jgi:hypothetical protein